jgi:hypothetical protein
MADILIEGSGDGGFLGLVAAELFCGFDHVIEIGHGALLLTLCDARSLCGALPAEKLATAREI